MPRLGRGKLFSMNPLCVPKKGVPSWNFKGCRVSPKIEAVTVSRRRVLGSKPQRQG